MLSTYQNRKMSGRSPRAGTSEERMQQSQLCALQLLGAETVGSFAAALPHINSEKD